MKYLLNNVIKISPFYFKLTSLQCSYQALTEDRNNKTSVQGFTLYFMCIILYIIYYILYYIFNKLSSAKDLLKFYQHDFHFMWDLEEVGDSRLGICRIG